MESEAMISCTEFIMAYNEFFKHIDRDAGICKLRVRTRPRLPCPRLPIVSAQLASPRAAAEGLARS
jgi:hypothetical protein